MHCALSVKFFPVYSHFINDTVIFPPKQLSTAHSTELGKNPKGDSFSSCITASKIKKRLKKSDHLSDHFF